MSFYCHRSETEFCVFSVTCEFEFGFVLLILYYAVTNSALCFQFGFHWAYIGDRVHISVGLIHISIRLC